MFGLRGSSSAVRRYFSTSLGDALRTMRLQKNAHWLDVKDSHSYLLQKYASPKSSEYSPEKARKIDEAFKVVDEYYTSQQLKINVAEGDNLSQVNSADELYEKLFIVHFKTSDRSALSLSENAVKKVLFEGEYQRQLRRVLGTTAQFMDDEFWSSQGTANQSSQSRQNGKGGFEFTEDLMGTAYKAWLGGFACLVLGMGGYVLCEEQQGNDTWNKVDSVLEREVKSNSNEFRSTEKSRLIEESYASQPEMKSWPIGEKSSNSIDQVVDYTIFGDLKMYHINSNYFYKELDDMTYMDHKKIVKKPLTGIRQNHMVSISIEAERSLQNIFIKAEDLKRIIKEKGYYECPGVFMRYKGFVYFRHRAKPIVIKDIENIPNNTNVSLFDIFHRYYSPLPEVYDEYYEYTLAHGGYIPDTTTLENSSWIGNVTFNHRSIPKLIIKGDEKNVFMWRGKNQDDPQESRYIKIWNSIYNYPPEPAVNFDNIKTAK